MYFLLKGFMIASVIALLAAHEIQEAAPAAKIGFYCTVWPKRYPDGSSMCNQLRKVASCHNGKFEYEYCSKDQVCYPNGDYAASCKYLSATTSLLAAHENRSMAQEAAPAAKIGFYCTVWPKVYPDRSAMCSELRKKATCHNGKWEYDTCSNGQVCCPDGDYGANCNSLKECN